MASSHPSMNGHHTQGSSSTSTTHSSSSSSSSSNGATQNGKPSSHPCYDASQIDYRALIALLSRAPYLPSATHVRNTLLSGLTSRQEPRDALQEVERKRERQSQAGRAGGTKSEEDKWWEILQLWQPGVRVGAFGEVPEEVLLPGARRSASARASAQQPTDTTGSQGQTGLWGLCILKSACVRTPGDARSYLMRPDLSIWLNSEALLQAQLQGQGDPDWLVPPQLEAGEEHVQMMRFVLKVWFPKALQELRQRVVQCMGEPVSPAPTILDGRPWTAEAGETPLIAFALGEVERKALLLVSERDKTAGLLGRGRVQVDWQNNCYTFQDGRWSGSEEDVRQEEEKWIRRMDGGERWKVERLDEKSAQLVHSSNKLAFPASHILRKPFLSRLVRDQAGPCDQAVQREDTADTATPSNEYAKVQGCGLVAGWVYTHEDVSLASLHVTEAYRRLGKAYDATTKASTATTAMNGDSSTAPPRVGIGRMLVALLSPQIARQQRRALHLLNIEPLPSGARTSLWPVVAESEMDNEGAVAFYHRCGFEVTGRHSWVGVRVWV